MNSLVIANVKQRPLRTAVSVVGVALGVILVVLVVGLARGTMRDAAERQANVDAELRFFPSGDITLQSNPLSLRAAYADAIQNGIQPTPDNPYVEPRPPVPGVAVASPVGTWLKASAGGIGFETVDGIDYPSFVKATSLQIVEGRAFSERTGETPVYEVIVDRYYLENNRDRDGRPLRVGGQIELFDKSFTVVGVYQPAVLGRIKMPLATLQEMLGGADNCSYIMIRTERPEMAAEVRERILEFYPGNNVILTEDLPALYSQGLRPVEIFLNVVISLATVISVLVILLAMYTTIIERTREIGILKSLGASRGLIVLTIEQEAVLISALGVALGFLISVAARFAIEASTRLKIDFEPRWFLIAAAIGLLGGIIGAIYPAVRAANLDPVEALSYE